MDVRTLAQLRGGGRGGGRGSREWRQTVGAGSGYRSVRYMASSAPDVSVDVASIGGTGDDAH